MIKLVSFIVVLLAVAAYYFQPLWNDLIFGSPELAPIVEISTGKIQGLVSYSRNGLKVHEYLRIPYAKAPIGQLRYEDPQPPDSWKGILSATTEAELCLQVDMISRFQGGQEDCLFLNVYKPAKIDGKLPVMVWIHGGLFTFGGTQMFRPRYFADENIILVTVAYRLGNFGFLSSGDGVIKGNFGLKDQVMALKWVQQNIEKFGGDKNKVTLAGESAGGCSVHLHMFSPMSKGLFHRGISQSGTAISPFVLMRHPKEQSKRFAKQMNCPTEDSKAMLACLRKLDSDTVVKPHFETTEIPFDKISVFSPTIEATNNSNTFLTEDPLTMLKNGKLTTNVPWITGVNSDEGLILSSTIAQNETLFNLIQSKWNEVIPKISFFERNDKVSEDLRKIYMKNSKKFTKEDHMAKITLLISDRAFFWPVSEAAQLQAKFSPVYLYYYSHVGDFSIANFICLFRKNWPFMIEYTLDNIMAYINRNIFGKRPHTYGCCHADEQFIQFNAPFAKDITKDDKENYEMSRDFVKLWADFIKERNELTFRNVKWTPVNPKKSPLRYLMIDLSYGMIDEPFESRIKYWKDNYVL